MARYANCGVFFAHFFGEFLFAHPAVPLRVFRGKRCPEIWFLPHNTSHLKGRTLPGNLVPTNFVPGILRFDFSPGFSVCIKFHILFYELNIARKFAPHRIILRFRGSKDCKNVWLLPNNTSRFRSWLFPRVFGLYRMSHRVLRGEQCPKIWCLPHSTSHLRE